jgi:hypothetical protein
MRTVRVVLVVLLALFGVGTKSAAQFSYTAGIGQFYQPLGNGYVGGFSAGISYRNINSYSDPSIVLFKFMLVGVSQRVVDFCNQYGLRADGCNMTLGGFGTSGNVQTGNIPIGDSFWIYNPRIDQDSCQNTCPDAKFMLAGFGLLGCQGPIPTPGDEYAGRTCDEDGYTGSLSVSATFQYTTQSVDIPPFIFDPSDLIVRAAQGVWNGPNGFVRPVPVPEPASWILMVTGLSLVAATARRRDRHITHL